MDTLYEVYCDLKLMKSLPGCEHSAQLSCSDDPRLHKCRSPCGGIMQCCGRDCKSSCSECQAANGRNGEQLDPITRTEHVSHLCQKLLYCGHQCGKKCSENHFCNTVCQEECRQQCSHARCKSPCSAPCKPCMEPCTWACQHFRCSVPCGSVAFCSLIPFSVH